MTAFSDYAFPPFIVDGLERLQFKEPTPVQTRVIPHLRAGEDVIGISSTGTGKTHAFLLPVLEMIDVTRPEVQAVICTPTRELALQIYQASRVFQCEGLKIRMYTGGTDRQKDIEQLKVQPHLVIGTPGRLKDLALNDGALKITTARIMIIDEADMMFDLGYLEDIDAIAGKMKDDLQLGVFSATIHTQLQTFLKKYMTSPVLIECNTVKNSAAHIQHHLLFTRHRSREEVLLELTEIISPYCCLVFCNTRQQAEKIYQLLLSRNLQAGTIHGDLQPRQRKAMMRRIRHQDFVYIVATDIAARGMDIDGVSHIINMGFPSDSDYYIHRAGRCGRASYSGECYTLYDSKDEKMIHLLESRGITFQYEQISDHQIKAMETRAMRQTKPKKQLPKEIAMVVNRPAKVKPGYKKKRKKEIDTLVKKRKREMIQADIRRQKKERAKKRQQNAAR